MGVVSGYRPTMKLNQLEQHLQGVASFDKPKVQFEQYPTQAHLASRIIYTAAQSFDDIEGKTVLDLGCGCGMLSIASVMMGAEHVIGADIDEDALAIAASNLEEFEMQEIVDLVQVDIGEQDGWLRQGLTVDTVVMNPPFGTRNKGIDSVFVEKAIELAQSAVYSLHKTSTRDHFIRKAEQWGVAVQVVAELKFDVPAIYSFHKKQSKDIEVDLIRFDCSRKHRQMS
eukprot:c5134_g1_i1.p1 GENE.c5134_g1_i1~~c5134_g1_i1.p1  ORF type:complete len:227 (-),score=43.40 c5134_g1_i1:373-1053(-)